jgi:1-acyl-sn-glycerol-3-phosphate acyltransferase
MAWGERLLDALPFVHFFAEGECYLYNQRINHFRPGAFMMAAEQTVPIVPLLMVLSPGPHKPFSFWGRSIPRKRLVVMDPIYPSAYVKRDAAGNIDNTSVRDFAEAVRQLMQAEIDRRGGCHSFYKGQMKRLKGINDR